VQGAVHHPRLGPPVTAARVVRSSGPLVLLLAACGGGDEGRCERLRDPAEQQDCHLEELATLFGEGDEAAFVEGLAALEDPLTRDLVRIRLAVDRPERSGWLCARVETEGARDKCRAVLGRPHLRAPAR